jgi:hypothetical protein
MASLHRQAERSMTCSMVMVVTVILQRMRQQRPKLRLRLLPWLLLLLLLVPTSLLPKITEKHPLLPRRS